VIDELNMYVFPNPSTGSISVNNLDIFEEVYLKIKDNLSHIVFSGVVSTSRPKVDLSRLNPGLYVYRIINESGQSYNGLLFLE